MAIETAAFVIVTRNWTLSPETIRTFGPAAKHFEHWEPARLAMGFFLHNNVLQLMLSLWFLGLVGCALEGWIGTPKFLALYFTAGLAGTLAKLGLMQTVPEVGRLLGPSPAMLGVIGASIYLLPFTRFDVWDSFGVFRSRSVGFSYRSSDAGWLDRLWGRHTYRDPGPSSGEISWPVWAIGLYFIVFDFLLTWLAASPACYAAVAVGLPVGFLLPLLLRQDREDVDISDAMAVFSETRDLGLLSAEELQALYRADPSNTTVLLNWIHRTLISRWGVAPACMDAFRRNLPSILENEPPEAVAAIVIALNKRERWIESRYEIYLGSQLEEKKHNQLAIDTYEAVRKSHDAAPEDVEIALFRLGTIYEKQLFNPYGAAHYYREMLQRFPMGDLAPQARARLAVVTARLTS